MMVVLQLLWVIMQLPVVQMATMGNLTTAVVVSTLWVAETTAIVALSTASGGATTAEDYLSFVIGVHNKTDETLTSSFLIKIPPLLLVTVAMTVRATTFGSPDTFSNAFEVLFGDTTTIAGDLNINSDARLKPTLFLWVLPYLNCYK